ncbi:MAG TPA: hypothetical protein VFW83_00220 [Bryobacteraceae bacterium]|nr:hypothetical protein [Bryobacteraceae bacterium]
MSKPTYDDVNLILRLYEIRREEKLRAARNWFVANFKCKTLDEFNKLCPPGSEPNAMARQVTSYWEMVASFITAGVLNEELFFQNTRELLLAYLRVQPLLGEIRAAFKDPSYMKNLETVGKSYEEYLNRTGPEIVKAFKARVGG